MRSVVPNTNKETDHRTAVVSGLSRVRILRKILGKPFFAANEMLWSILPPALSQSALGRRYGHFVYSLVKLRIARGQYFGTFFFRNRAELAMLGRLVQARPQGATVKIAVLACSNGAEVYSILWTIRKLRPDLKLSVQAMDISPAVLEIARQGRYSLTAPEMVDSPIFEYNTIEEIEGMFDRQGDQVSVKPFLKEGISWSVADARDPQMPLQLGTHDIVFASKFLFHMNPSEAAQCLRNVTRLINPGGYLFVSGVDLDVRSAVMSELGWLPVQEMLEDMHNGDPQVRRDWPLRYWGLEPLTKSRHDWQLRYASLFRAPEQDVEEITEEKILRAAGAL